ncbi:ABC transporter ATP-binding protein [Rhizobium sp. BK251]|uniref:ABC transporter ATP-binding protein n=1 Tax=Rhizobium sp. BK251 TaxID=2512125 RepID=UPI00104D1ACB|nr:ABC transporter ATP-binding protein [Rhizobium sp. BK251]TCL65250.1 iron(III) transport system ATP-binding protein [Rhizobium sp. BK251]
MNDKPAALDLKNISRRFGRTKALHDLSLTIRKGEIVCLVGHSGCGKSTLLRIVAGIEAPDTGTVRMHGEEVAGPSGFVQPEHRRIGFVFQDYALFPHLTVEENIGFGLTRYELRKAGQRIGELIDRLGLKEMVDRYPHTLSGGEQQRVALARALARDPRVMLLDEPFSNLDRALRERVRRDTLSLLRELQTTAIIVTHDPEEALSSGDRVVLMRGGEIVQSGSGYELYDFPNSAYAAEFFAAYNKVPGKVRSGRIETVLGDFPLRMPLPDGASAVAYIRPQDIELGESSGHRSGKLLDRSLMGEIEQVAIGVEGLAAPLQVRSTKRLEAANDDVTFRFSGSSVVAFGLDE